VALADLDDSRGLDLGIQYSAYGYMDRARPAAIKAVGKLAHHDPDRAVGYLITLLDDPERRTVSAAGDALATTGDERAIEPLRAVSVRAVSEAHPNARLRRQAERWLKKLEE
jgi:HEAT repeat protein